MICVAGVWLPDSEQHLLNVDRLVSANLELSSRALDLCSNFSLSLDVGAHLGLWSRWMVGWFDSLHAFEPMAEHCECWRANISQPNFVLHQLALGKSPGRVRMVSKPGISEKTYVQTGDEIEMRSLDSFGFEGVGLLKVDCEGYDYFVLRGAKNLLRAKPVVVFESKLGVSKKRYNIDQGAPHKFLESLGYSKKFEVNGNYIYS